MGTVTATDDDGDTLTYMISGGADATLFSLDPSTGELVFNASPDFEEPADADGDNVYEVEVTASDGTNDTVQAMLLARFLRGDLDGYPTFIWK